MMIINSVFSLTILLLLLSILTYSVEKKRNHFLKDKYAEEPELHEVRLVIC